MRSSKSRSRSKQNRSRSVGNIVNRVFDSSGPEGKVRGTPQQIIEKYNQLARDAQLSNDRVAAENFQQHAEHYTRMLAEAMRELESQRQEQGQNSQRPDNRDQQGRRDERGDEPGRDFGRDFGRDYGRDEAARGQPDAGEQPDVPANGFVLAETVAPEAAEEESMLVETPESAPSPKPRSSARGPRKLRPATPKPDEAAE
jgi:hypothetical protein